MAGPPTLLIVYYHWCKHTRPRRYRYQGPVSVQIVQLSNGLQFFYPLDFLGSHHSEGAKEILSFDLPLARNCIVLHSCGGRDSQNRLWKIATIQPFDDLNRNRAEGIRSPWWLLAAPGRATPPPPQPLGRGGKNSSVSHESQSIQSMGSQKGLLVDLIYSSSLQFYRVNWVCISQ